MFKDKIEYELFGKIFLISNQLMVRGDSLSQDLTLKQWMLLLFLCKGKDTKPSLNILAEKMGGTRQSVKKMLTLLQEKGFVVMKRSEQDVRAFEITPNENAFAFFRSNKKLGDEFLGEVFEGFTQEELESLWITLNKMLGNLKTENLKMEES